MIASPVLAALVVQVALGCGGLHGKRDLRCETCGAESAKVARDISILRTSRRWRERDDAAHRLAKANPECHPEILPALVAAMLRDCEDEVREEAAESLKKLSPCVPEVHEALARAALCDPDSGVRREAKKALSRLDKTCRGDCSACRPGEVVRVGPLGPPEPMLIVPGDASPSPEVEIPGPGAPAGAVPEPSPGPSPFGPGGEASRGASDRTLSRPANRPAARTAIRPVPTRLRVGR